jgi:hypothetical protein
VPAGTLLAAASFGLLALELYASLSLSGDELLGATRGRLWELGRERRAAALQLLRLLERAAPPEAPLGERSRWEHCRPLFSYGEHTLASTDLAACLRFLLHGISYHDGGQRRRVDGHASRQLIDAMLRAATARLRTRAWPQE